MNSRHQKFVNEMLQHGDNVKAYLAAYPKCKESSARNAANRLLQHPEIEQAISGTQQRIRTEIETDLRHKLEEQVLGELQIKLLLSQIATGQHETERTFCLKDGSFETVHVKPTHHQVLRALYMLAKMQGLFPPAVPPRNDLAAPATSGDSSLRKASVRNDDLDGAASVPNDSLDGGVSVRNDSLGRQDSISNPDSNLPSWRQGPGSFSEYYAPDYHGSRWDPDDPNTQEQFYAYLVKREQELKQQLTTIQTRMANGSARLREFGYT